MRRREAPPHTIWVLICPDTGGYSYSYFTTLKNKRSLIKTIAR
ncbi:hypothetical protein [Pseudanabaena sp. SR411]|nr:hypothetical protein [Pseudanabaena sp. SR411]